MHSTMETEQPRRRVHPDFLLTSPVITGMVNHRGSGLAPENGDDACLCRAVCSTKARVGKALYTVGPSTCQSLVLLQEVTD